MQRVLSLMTLGVIAAFAWIFLQGGGLSQLGNDPTAARNPNGFDLRQASPPMENVAAADRPREQLPVDALPQDSDPVLRIASFNIQTFGNKKASTTRVMFALADIVRRFDLVAVQEIRSKNEYLIPNFVRLINKPTQKHKTRRFEHVIGPRIGNTTSKEQYAYIFDTDRVEIDPFGTYTVGDPDNLLHREPLVASFRARGVDPASAFTFTLVNFHIDPDIVQQELDVLAEVYRVVRRSGRNEDDVILVGDFNTSGRRLYRLGRVPGIYPLISDMPTNTRKTEEYDNIIIHRPSTTEYTGRSGVFDIMRQYNITEAQALEVSDHLPVWAEFSQYERDHNGRIARRGGATSRW